MFSPSQTVPLPPPLMTARGQSSAKAVEPAQLQVGEVSYALAADRGPEEAWADLYRRLFHELCDSAARLIGPHDAADAVQEAMLQIWKRRKQLPPEARTAQYLARAVHNHVINRFRASRHEVQLTDEIEATLTIELPDAEHVPITIMADKLDAIVAAMPPRCREAYGLVHERHLSGADAAAVMGVSLPTFRTHVARMNVILRAAWQRAALEFDSDAPLPLPPESHDLPRGSAPLLPSEVPHD